MQNNTTHELTEESINQMDGKQLISSVVTAFEFDELERAKLLAFMQLRAKELKMSKDISDLIRVYAKADKQAADEFTRQYAMEHSDIPLTLDSKGATCQTIDNILTVMRHDERYSGVCYNLLRNCPEVLENGKLRRWTDTDESESKRYIEQKYGIYSDPKHYDALRVLLKEREYHPILEIIEGIAWDGTERIESFLTKWMKAPDKPYTREVSRLIFAGGINRLYNPGCKFDNVPILIGTLQGEGKSTIVRWLALKDDFYSEVTEVDGQKSIEQLEGAWICEVAELLALTKSKEQEAVKAYITRQKDKYRRPYDRQTQEYPRRCIFIGTTNSEQFLKDKTGNRRFYPVKVHSSGYDLFAHEAECREYIRQCWAEAREKLMRGQMPPFADPKLIDEYLAAQDEAMEDDWRVGAIEDYLSRKHKGDVVCIRQIFHEALSVNRDAPKDPTPKESQEVGVIMNRFADWEKSGRMRVRGYGLQRVWVKTLEENANDLPFI